MNQLHSAPLTHDELSIDVDVTDDAPARHRPDDTWQALGRAIGDARADEIVRSSAGREPSQTSQRVLVAPYIAAPPARHVLKAATPSARVPESLYPVELPAREPQAAMSAQHPAFPWKETADASLSMQLPVRKPRGLRTARMVVGGVTAVSALVCVLALLMSRMNAEDAVQPSTGAASQPPPEAQTTLPEKQSLAKSELPVRDLAGANVQTTSWAKNVMGSGDRPGVSVDSLPRAEPRAAARKGTKKR